MIKRKLFWKQIFVFNKKYFLAACCVIACCIVILLCFPIALLWKCLLALVVAGTFYLSVVSLVSSYFIYDRSDLYKFNWLKKIGVDNETIFNVYSGYSESGHLLNSAFPEKNIIQLDFFNAAVSVTDSIKIANKLGEPLEHISIDYRNWNIRASAGTILFMQSLHELRTMEQKVWCLMEATRSLDPGGTIIVSEHLCNLKNFLIYGPGAFHFFGSAHWKHAFAHANLYISSEKSITPFVKVYILSPS